MVKGDMLKCSDFLNGANSLKVIERTLIRPVKSQVAYKNNKRSDRFHLTLKRSDRREAESGAEFLQFIGMGQEHWHQLGGMKGPQVAMGARCLAEGILIIRTHHFR